MLQIPSAGPVLKMNDDVLWIIFSYLCLPLEAALDFHFYKTDAYPRPPCERSGFVLCNLRGPKCCSSSCGHLMNQMGRGGKSGRIDVCSSHKSLSLKWWCSQRPAIQPFCACTFIMISLSDLLQISWAPVIGENSGMSSYISKLGAPSSVTDSSRAAGRSWMPRDKGGEAPNAPRIVAS